MKIEMYWVLTPTAQGNFFKIHDPTIFYNNLTHGDFTEPYVRNNCYISSFSSSNNNWTINSIMMSQTASQQAVAVAMVKAAVMATSPAS